MKSLNLAMLKLSTMRVAFVKEIAEVKHGELEVTGISIEELEQIQEYLCTQ